MNILLYNGHQIQVDSESGYWNATQMCQANGKKLSHWRKLKTTEEYIQELAADAGIPASELLSIRKGGNSQEQGTWIHRLLVWHLAQWISAKFYLRCNKHIDELYTTGSTMLETERQRREHIHQEISEWCGKGWEAFEEFSVKCGNDDPYEYRKQAMRLLNHQEFTMRRRDYLERHGSEAYLEEFNH